MIPIAVAFFKVHPAKKEKSQKTFSQRPSNTCRTQAIQRLLVQGNPRSYRCLPIVRRPCPLTFAIDKNIFPSPSPFPSRGRGIGNLIPRPVSSGKCGFENCARGRDAPSLSGARAKTGQPMGLCMGSFERCSRLCAAKMASLHAAVAGRPLYRGGGSRTPRDFSGRR